jgi:hypothetical protein
MLLHMDYMEHFFNWAIGYIDLRNTTKLQLKIVYNFLAHITSLPTINSNQDNSSPYYNAKKRINKDMAQYQFETHMPV